MDVIKQQFDVILKDVRRNHRITEKKTDSGYVEKGFSRQISILLRKKKKGKDLTDPQKAWNRIQRYIKIKAEHAISRIREFRYVWEQIVQV